MYSENQVKSYFSMEVALDSELEGLNMKSYKKKENIAFLIQRAAMFISKIYLNVEKKSVAIDGRWESLLGSSVISFNKVNNKYSGKLVKASETTFSFKDGDEAYKINMPLTRKKMFSELGSMQVKYLKGSSEWIPAKYSIYGCLLIIDPVSESAPIGKSFFYKNCHK